VIFAATTADGYEWLECDIADAQKIFDLTGAPMATDWKPIPVRRITKAKGKTLARSDFPSLVPYRLVMRRSAAEALASFWENSGELLPLRSDDRTEFVILNVTKVLDALDEQRSDVLRLDGGEIVSIRTPVFVETVVRESDVFRLPHRGSPTYLSHRFIAAVDALGLKGLDFVSGTSSGEGVH
jgi:hypothetical protein